MGGGYYDYSSSSADSGILLVAYIIGLLVSLGVAFIFSFIGARKAEEKGYSKGGWWCLIFFCGIVPFIIICCLPSRIDDVSKVYSNRWVCTKCNTVNFGGYTCSKCGAYKGQVTQWTCKCGNKNKMTDKFCSACGMPQPDKNAQSQKVGSWKCSCGAILTADDAFCAQCGKPKIVSAPVIPESSKKWTCPSCGFANAESVRTCNGCGKEKPTEKKVETVIIGEKWFCPYCGEQNRYEAKRCIGCGKDKPIV